MNKFYVINYCYQPNTAAINRVESFVKRFSERGVKLTWVFIMPSLKCDRVAIPYKNVEIKYLWKGVTAHNRVLKHIVSFLFYALFLLKLNRNDIVYVYGCYTYIGSLFKRKVRLYHETTEHPNAIMKDSILFSTKKYLSICASMAGVFVISRQLKDFFINSGCNANKVHIINMTVDPSRFEGLVKQNVPKYIAYCGNGSNNKDGVNDLMLAFSIFSKSFPQYKLYIIGKAPSLTDSFIEQLKYNNHNILDNIVFFGIVKSSEIPHLLFNAEILALARPNSLQANYGFPTKLGEYLLTGNPVVVTRTGDIPSYLSDKDSALLCEDKNPIIFAENLRWLVENPSEAKMIGRKGRIIALSQFNSNTEADKILDVIFS